MDMLHFILEGLFVLLLLNYPGKYDYLKKPEIFNNFFLVSCQNINSPSCVFGESDSKFK